MNRLDEGLMLATQPRENRNYDLAQHYLAVLRSIAVAYRRGHDNFDYALTLFDQEWLQIKHQWAWTVTHMGDDDEIVRLCQKFSMVGAEVLMVRLPPGECEELFEAGLVAARLLHHPQGEMIHLYLLARTKSRSGSRDRAMLYAQQALALAEQVNDRLYVGKILYIIGTLFYHQDEYEQAQRMYKRAFAISQKLNETIDMGFALTGLGHVAHSQGDFASSRKFDEQYLQIAETNGQPYDICMALRNLSTTTLHMGDVQAATRYAERCVALSEAIQYKSCLMGALIILGDLTATHGNLLQSWEYYQRGLAISHEVSHFENEALALCQLGRLSRLLGDMPASFEYLQAAFDLAERVGDRWYCTSALLEMASTFRVAHDLPQAHTRLVQGLEIAYAIQNPIILAIYLLEAAWLWYEQGHMTQAAYWLGFLESNFSLLTPEAHAEYHELYQNLAIELGPTSFTRALEQGRALDLESIVQGLWHELGGTSNLSTTTSVLVPE